MFPYMSNAFPSHPARTAPFSFATALAASLSNASLPFNATDGSAELTLVDALMASLSDADAVPSLGIRILSLDRHIWAWIIGGTFAFMACVISTIEMIMHCRYSNDAKLRKHTLRILLMVPLYAINAFFGLYMKDSVELWDLAREAYEAVVIYSFYQFLVEYLGGAKRLVYLATAKDPELDWYRERYRQQQQRLGASASSAVAATTDGMQTAQVGYVPPSLPDLPNPVPEPVNTAAAAVTTTAAGGVTVGSDAPVTVGRRRKTTVASSSNANAAASGSIIAPLVVEAAAAAADSSAGASNDSNNNNSSSSSAEAVSIRGGRKRGTTLNNNGDNAAAATKDLADASGVSISGGGRHASKVEFKKTLLPASEATLIGNPFVQSNGSVNSNNRSDNAGTDGDAFSPFVADGNSGDGTNIDSLQLSTSAPGNSGRYTFTVSSSLSSKANAGPAPIEITPLPSYGMFSPSAPGAAIHSDDAAALSPPGTVVVTASNGVLLPPPPPETEADLHPKQHYHILPFSLIFKDPVSPERFVVLTKFGALQYVPVQLTLCFITFLLHLGGVEGEWSWSSYYPYFILIINFSQIWAMYGLFWFYHGYHKQLEPCRPLAKALCIKGVVFFTFWQSVIISIWSYFFPVECTDHPSAHTDLPQCTDDQYSTSQRALTLQNFIICIEMFIFAILHMYVFSWKEFKARRGRDERTLFRRFVTFFNPRDMVVDMRRNIKPDTIRYIATDAPVNMTAEPAAGAEAEAGAEGGRDEEDGTGALVQSTIEGDSAA